MPNIVDPNKICIKTGKAACDGILFDGGLTQIHDDIIKAHQPYVTNRNAG